MPVRLQFALLRRSISFLVDVGVHDLGKGALNSHYGIVLDEHILLDEPEAVLASVGWSVVQVPLTALSA